MAGRPLVICESCRSPLRLNDGETEQTRVSRHKAAGACRPLVMNAKKAKAPSINVKSTLGGGWDL